MMRKPWFWIVFALLTGLCLVYAVTNFSKAYPLVTLDLKMSREAALAEARRLAEQYSWGPEEARTAAAFDLDNQVQSFVELEAGGTGAFAEMLAGDLYSPYVWRVRLFAEHNANETLVRFTPAGKPYGFREKLPEEEPGAALEDEAARVLAEEHARNRWKIRLDEYELVEAAQEVRPSGRVDHTLVYERPGERLGEGRYRLRLGVSGDRFTELTHFVKIPEAFERRYEEMRAANTGIAAGSTVAMVVLYLAGGCAVGLFLLLRARAVLWKQPVLWALIICFLNLLAALNRWPLWWMGYDTALSSTTFLLQRVAVAVALFVGMSVVLAVTFMAAEGLTRKAFGDQIQLWRSWSTPTAATPAMLGRTVAGYLLVVCFFAYEVVLYFVAGEHLGWWTPSTALFDPNVLANYFPWLTSIAVSLQAGFWEECLFRAVPLASAALLGRRFGKRWLWITAAIILQAVIFGAGHANYPAQPAYARLVELIVPSLAFAGLYLTLGLVPAIVMHFAYDVVWFALPLFATSAPGTWDDRIIVILLTLVPLFVVLRARWRAGAWRQVDDEDFNRAWEPPPAPEREAPAPAPTAMGLGARARLVLMACGAACLVVWLLAADFDRHAPAIAIGTAEARTTARQAVLDTGFALSDDWKELAAVNSPRGIDDRFVWQEGGAQLYGELLGTYLPSAGHLVRYARFEGDVVERAEELRVLLRPDGTIRRLTHQLPEGRAGAELDEETARRIALVRIGEEYGLSGDQIREISAEPSQLQARRDWKLVFAEPAAFPLEQGEARLAVKIAGDEVVDSQRFIHVPEEWQRSDRSRRGMAGVVATACTVLMVLLFFSGAVVAIVRWAKGHFALGTFALATLILTVIGAVGMVNRWQSVTAGFVTAQPFGLQVGIAAVLQIISVLSMAAGVALFLGLTHRWLGPQPASGTGLGLAAGAALGVVFAGLAATASALAPVTTPQWPDYSIAAFSFPLLGAALAPLGAFARLSALLLFVVAAVLAISRGWTCRRAAGSAALVLLGPILAGAGGIDSVSTWLVQGLFAGAGMWLAFVLVLRRHPALLPVAVGAATVLGTVRQGVQDAFPGALVGAIVGSLIIAVLACLWFMRLKSDTSADAPQAEAEG